MRVFLYEFVTGGGLLHSSDSASLSLCRSLRQEGEAMIRALAEDFLRIEDCQVTTLRDQRFDELHSPRCEVHQVDSAEAEETIFRRLAGEADWTVVIAPEFDGYLVKRTRWVEEVSGRLLSPDSLLVALASDKQRTADHLARAGLPVPESRLIQPGESLPTDFSYPAVIKPLDGAGSIETHFITEPSEQFFSPTDKPLRLERFYPGTAASVAFLCGPAGYVAMPPCRQRIADDRSFSYLGGSFPLDTELRERASTLTRRAVETLESPMGYLGVDLILGEHPSGDEDVILEVNPRLTTSYVGLRLATEQNLAAAMMHVADGDPPTLEFDFREFEFDVQGNVC